MWVSDRFQLSALTHPDGASDCVNIMFLLFKLSDGTETCRRTWMFVKPAELQNHLHVFPPVETLTKFYSFSPFRQILVFLLHCIWQLHFLVTLQTKKKKNLPFVKAFKTQCIVKNSAVFLSLSAGGSLQQCPAERLCCFYHFLPKLHYFQFNKCFSPRKLKLAL